MLSPVALMINYFCDTGGWGTGAGRVMVASISEGILPSSDIDVNERENESREGHKLR